MTLTSGAREELDRERDRLLELYVATRAHTERLAGPLSPEDQQLQSMPEASPTKWHRAHTTWFFEAFVLEPQGVAPVDARYAALFNSYYEAMGPRHPRAARGLLSRPSAAEVGEYRREVDERIVRLVRSVDSAALARIAPVVELGIAHEEQHQELILTDILHALAQSPLRPAYRPAPARTSTGPAPQRFVAFEGGLCEIGAPAGAGFAFDNEQPRHKRWLEPFAIADRLVAVRELKAFLDEGGYRKASLWLSDGFDYVRAHGIVSPLYTTYADGRLEAFTLEGTRTLGDDEPALHVSYYEADAIARFLGARLPTEIEWEVAAEASARAKASPLRELFTEGWQWTSSGYEPYPGYRPPQGALGEYNGKFMVSQMVLRGGSSFTPRRHTRATYRNFWHPQTRFQRTGLRLARGAS